jgi:hypothetical protein
MSWKFSFGEFMLRRLILVVLFLVSLPSQAITYTIEVTEQELQQKVEAMMPIEKKKYFVKVTLSDPQVDLLEESNEIGLRTQINISGPGVSESGVANIKGSLEYKKKEGAFYLHNPSIIDLNFETLSNEMTEMVMKLAKKALVKATAKRPVYRFKDDKLKDQMAKAVLESIAVENERLKVTLKLF